MNKETIAKDINKAINKHLERVSLSQGNVRYWPQEFITQAMLDDDELFQDFQIIFDTPINTDEQIEEIKLGTRHKKTNVGRISK